MLEALRSCEDITPAFPNGRAETKRTNLRSVRETRSNRGGASLFTTPSDPDYSMDPKMRLSAPTRNPLHIGFHVAALTRFACEYGRRLADQ